MDLSGTAAVKLKKTTFCKNTFLYILMSQVSRLNTSRVYTLSESSRLMLELIWPSINEGNNKQTYRKIQKNKKSKQFTCPICLYKLVSCTSQVLAVLQSMFEDGVMKKKTKCKSRGSKIVLRVHNYKSLGHTLLVEK